MPFSPVRALAPLVLTAAVASMARTPVLADGTVTIHIANGSTDNLLVTLYDRNLRRRQKVLSGQVIYGNASISASISADASGRGHVYWTAITTDRDLRQCGQHDTPHVNDGETIHVSADGPCAHPH
jgi:hypothetical protein